MIRSEDVRPGGMRDLLHAQTHEGRKAVIADLGREGTPRAVALLLEVLTDHSWSLRELAVEALASSPELSAPRLMELLDAGLWYTRAAAMRGLGLMGHGAALPGLLRQLDDPNRAVSAEAAKALLALAERGRAVAVTRGIVARGDGARDTLATLDRVDPDASRKIRILANRDELVSPAKEWASGDANATSELPVELIASPDSDFGVEWERVMGPVGD